MNTIRPGTPEDFAAFCGLLTENGLVHEDLTPAHMAGFLIIPAQEGSSFLGAVAGVETFPGADEGLLRSVAVVPALRGKGVAKGLVSALEKRAGTLGLRRLWLLTTTAPDFFRRLGYADTPRAQAPAAVQQSGEFKNLCPASAVCLSKPI